jgi:hypothetical protein
VKVKVDTVSAPLKAFVIGAGIVLVVGTIVLAVLLVLRATGGMVGEAPGARALPRELLLPAGARVEQVVPDGRRVILLGVDGSGRQFLALIDPTSGERLSLIRIRPEE